MAAKIRKGDQVVVIAGKSKGSVGEVTKVIVARDRVLVDGVNLVKKHQKPVPQLNQPGGIVEKEAPIHVSNIAIYNSKTNKADRVGFRFENGKKVRFFKSTNELI